MNAESFANLVDARRTGAGRWKARCPAHSPDRHPSLTIAQGERGILLRCWAGCSLDRILAPLHIPVSALFDDAGLTPQQRAHAAVQRQAHDAERKAQHHAECQRNGELLRLESLRDALGAKLVRSPHDAEIARLFHAIEDKLHTLESGLPHHEDGPHRQESLPESPVATADALYQIGQDFAPKEKAASQAA